MENKKITLGAASFLPLIVFLIIYVGNGIYFTVTGVASPFGQFPRHVALLIGIALALLMVPKVKISDKLEVLSKNMGNSGVMMIILIYLMAGGFQGAAAVTGGRESVINLSLSYIPSSLLIPGIFLMCCIISTSIGTSMGTIAAMAPIAIGVGQGAGLNLAMISAAVIGGSYFGDNLSMISDTTIAAAQGLGSSMRDKFKMNFFIALPAAIIAMILYGIFGGQATSDVVAGDFNIILVLPYFIVLFAALKGMNVALVLFIGMFSSLVLGLLLGTANFYEIIQGIGNGMQGLFSISIMAALISGIIGLVKFYGGIEWLISSITSKIKTRKGAEYGIGLLSGLLSASMINNTLGIIVSSPIAKEIGGKFKIAPKRLASIVDIFACSFLALMPHDGGMLILTELAGVSPLSVLQYSFYIFALIITTSITIQFGLLRTKEEQVELKA